MVHVAAMNKRPLLAAGAAVLVVLGFAGARMWWGADPSVPPPTAPKGELSAAQLQRMGIRIEPASAAQAMPLGTVPAQVSLPPQARVAVTSPFAGVVTQVLVSAGQQVAQGQALAVVRAAEPVQFGAELARAQADLPVLRANAARLGQLAREGIIAPARADEAQAALQRGQASVAEQQRLLAMAGASRNGTVTLRAPIAGRLAMVGVDAGAAVGNGAAPFVVENLSALRLDMQVPERLAGQLRAGMAVTVAASDAPAGAQVKGRILGVAASLDPQSRSVPATAALEPGAALVPGKGVMVTVSGSGGAGVSVPSAAVTRIGDEDCLFVRRGNSFERRQITVAAQANNRAYISAGLKPGEQVAVSGIAELKSLMAEQ